MPIKFMVHSLCGNRNGYERNTNRDVYHELKGTGTRLRPPLHSFRTRALWSASLHNALRNGVPEKREDNSHFSPLRKSIFGSKRATVREGAWNSYLFRFG